MEYVLHFTKRLYAYAGKILYINLLGMVLISFLEGIGILLLIPMISFSGMMNLNASSSPLVSIFEFLQNVPQTLGLPVILGIYILLVIGQNLLQRGITIRNAKIQQGFFRHLRLEIYRSLLQANWHFFINKRKSDLINSLTSELARVNSGTNLILQFLASLIFALIQVGIALWLSTNMTVFVLGCGLVLFFFSRTFIKRARTLGNQTSDLAQSYLAGITDDFNGIKDIKSNTLEKSRIHWFYSVTQRILHEQLEYIRLRSTSQLFYKITSAILIAGFIFLSVNLFHAQPEQLLLIIVIFSRLWPRFTIIQTSMEQIASTIPALKALKELQDESKEARELNERNDDDKMVEPIRLEQGLECQHVYFRYNRNESVYALQDITVQIPSNHMTAIVGRSGAGKSTLIDILMGLMKPEKGQVVIDGVPLTSHHLVSLRQSISYVSQDPFLFNGSLRENLLMIEPHAREEDLWHALEFSASAEFVRKLPKGLDTLIGDRGVKLSGGERQRIVLARAILRKPSILILDEATSSLDSENEAKIQEALDRLKGKMTIIVIAHRLSTIRNADQVIVLDQGRMIQKGGFNQLAKEKRGLFSHLLGNQIEAANQ